MWGVSKLQAFAELKLKFVSLENPQEEDGILRPCFTLTLICYLIDEIRSSCAYIE